MNMESKLQQNLSDIRPVPVYVLPYTDQDDEISLIDLWRVIAARKNLILWSFLAALALAAVYAFLAEPVYRAETQLLPPQQQDVQGLMIGKEGIVIPMYTPDTVYSTFLTSLKSRGLRREFFDTHNLTDDYLAGRPQTDGDATDVFYKQFNENLQIQAGAQDLSFVSVSYAGVDPELAAQRLNQFIAFANERTVLQLLGSVNTAIQAEIKNIHSQLNSKLKLAAQRRQDKILILQEALRIARVLDIENADNFSGAASKEKAAIEVNTARVPLYMRGVKALEAEITVLESRKSDEPFISGLRDLQEKLAFYKGLSINPDKLSAVTIDAAARTPLQTEKPRKKLIFILAGVLGLMIGVFLIFTAEFRSKIRAV